MSNADALVVFGITGDLAKKMTLRSLYRLERRDLLGLPVTGVAVEDWTVERLRDHARESIIATGEQLDEDVFARFAARLGYVSGDFNDPGTYDRVARALGDAKDPVFYLEVPPSLFGTVIAGSIFGKFSFTHCSIGTLVGPSVAKGVNQRSISLPTPSAAVESRPAAIKKRMFLIRIIGGL